MSNAGSGIALLVVGIALAGAVGVSAANVTHVATQTCTVTDKDRTKNSEGNSEMRVYTNECDVLEVAAEYVQLSHGCGCHAAHGDQCLVWTTSREIG